MNSFLWRLANQYFHLELSSINRKNNLNEAMSSVNSTAYNYFRDNYGYKNIISEEEIALKKRYKHFFKKKELKALKLDNVSINVIKYVTKEIISGVNKNPVSITIATDNDDEIIRHFWAYAKKVFRSGTSVLPSFDGVQGTAYFINALKCVNRMKVFTIPF